MKKVFLLNFFLPFTLIAQPIVTADFFPEEGTVLEYVNCSLVDVQENNVGANAIWDFSDMAPLMDNALFIYEFIDPELAPDISEFPEVNASFRLVSGGGKDTSFFYYILDNESHQITGLRFNSSFLKWFNDQTEIVFPATYETTWNDNWSHSINGTEGEILTAEGIVEGYGTLILPNATYFNVLRIKTEDTDSFGYPGNIRYRYVSSDYKFWLLDIIPGNQNNYLKNPVLISSTSDIEKYRKAKVYPNPSNGEIRLNVGPLESGEAVVEIYSVTGIKVLSNEHAYFNNREFDLRTSNILDQGVYLVLINIEGILYSTRIVIE